MQRWLFLGVVGWACACSTPVVTSPQVVAQQVGAAWVFVYEQEPASGMDALHTGDALIDEEECLRVGDGVVVWREAHLPQVAEIVAALEAGDAVVVTVGGGGWSLAEGDSRDDFPAAVNERCAGASTVWEASGDPLVLAIDEA